MIQDIKNELVQGVAMISAISSDTTVNGASVDTVGYLSLTFMLSFSAFTDGTYTFTIQESEDDSTWSDIADDKYIGDTESDAVVTAATGEGEAVQSIGVFSNRRYVRLVCTSSSVTTGASVAALTVACPEVKPNTY